MIFTYSEDERVDIGNALDKLFVSQDKFLSNDKRTLLIGSLQECALPCGAVLKGLKSLYDADLKQVKLFIIKNAIRKFIEKNQRPGCGRCSGSGYITMVDSKNNEFAFACLCELGHDKKDIEKLAQWNGLTDQNVHGKIFKLRDPIIASRSFGLYSPEEN